MLFFCFQQFMIHRLVKQQGWACNMIFMGKTLGKWPLVRLRIWKDNKGELVVRMWGEGTLWGLYTLVGSGVSSDNSTSELLGSYHTFFLILLWHGHVSRGIPLEKDEQFSLPTEKKIF
jgi:hypothetical protein